jgi:SAM-dependent methyltransferase
VGARDGGGSAGDADYGAIGSGYTRHRRPDPSIARVIDHALGSARTVCNVGAGAGSYEPLRRQVVAVEPSATMRAQRAPGLARCIAASAEALPFATDAVDASMTTFSVHQWGDLEAGLAEMRRVARGQVVVLTCDPDRLDQFWLMEYAPEVLAVEAARYPGLDRLRAGLGGNSVSAVVPVPLDCADGFTEAYFGRPEKLLDRAARRSCSAWSFVDGEVHERVERELRRDLADGSWDRRHGHLRYEATYAGSLVLVVAAPVG